MEDAGRYARRRGRRALELALSRGGLDADSARWASGWLRQEQQRRERHWWVPAWSGFGLAAVVVALFY